MIEFNARVLEAMDESTPLLECALPHHFHTNLDEFFMIRVSGIKQQVAAALEVLSLRDSHPVSDSQDRSATVESPSGQMLAFLAG